MEEDKIYQFKIEKALQDHGIILRDMSNVLKEMGKTMKSFSEISAKQIKHELIIHSLEEDSKEFKEFIKNKSCTEHDVAIKNLNKSDDSQNKNTASLIIGFFVSLLTGIVTWLATKG